VDVHYQVLILIFKHPSLFGNSGRFFYAWIIGNAMNNWSTILNNAKTSADIVAILRNVLAQLDSKSFTQIEELFQQTDLTAQQKMSALQDLLINAQSYTVEKQGYINQLIEFWASGNAGQMNWLAQFVALANGRTLENKMQESVSIKDFGAIGDGNLHPLSERFASLSLAQAVYPFATSLTNSIDWAALQAGIHYCAGGIASLYIPKGTYVLHAPRQGSQICMVNISSNLSIVGAGYDSCLKIANGYSSGGDYRVMASASGAVVDNFRMSGVRFDGNAANNLVLDSSANVRRAYAIHILAGKNPAVTDCFFDNIPGRNVICLGDNTNPPSISNAVITNNRFNNMGGACIGNQKQNDHSTIYCQSQKGLVAFNHFDNDAVFDPQATPAFACVALEIHGNQTDVIGNIVNNYGTGGNAVASVHDSYDNRWLNNKFMNMVSNALTLWTANNFRNQRLTIRGNLITINNVNFAGGSGILQNTQSSITSRQLDDLVIEDNTIQYLSEVSKANTVTGIQLTAVNGGTIRRNKIYNSQGTGIHLAEAVSKLDIHDVDISDNELNHCGIHASLTRLWGIYIENTDTAKLFSDIRINRNKFIKRLPASIGAAPFTTRGVRVAGGGMLQDIVIGADNTFKNIDRAQRIEFVNTTNSKNVVAQKLSISTSKSALPTRGLFAVEREMLQYTDAVGGGAVGRIVTIAGAASEAVWTATTNYSVGQWIRTNTGKVLVCLQAGTSGSLEPAPTTLGITLTDGSVTWVYRDSASAVFAEYGASFLSGTATYTPAAIVAGAKFTVSVSVPAVTLGDIAMASYSSSLQGLTISAHVDMNNVVNVTFANNTANPVTLAAGTIYVRAFKQ
jgi:hypothetical protein